MYPDASSRLSIGSAVLEPQPHARVARTSFPLLAVLALLALHLLVWTWVGTVGRSNLDGPGDMVEAFVWGHAWQWGYFKHPPLMAWMAGAWFAVMPSTHGAYALLASLNTAIGLLGFALLCHEFMTRRWVAVSLAAALLMPGVTTVAMRFNANAVLVATWPWVSLFFVRYMQRGQRRDALVCALACALAMLGKYFSVVLLASLVLSAWVHVPWRRRLLTRRTLYAALLFLLLLTPHLIWLATHEFGPLTYARAATQDVPGNAAARGAQFVWGQLLFALLGWLLIGLSVAPGQRQHFVAAFRSLLRPARTPAWTLALLPLLLTAAGTAITGARTSVVWGLPMTMGLLMFVTHELSRRGAIASLRRPRRFLAGMWLAVVALAPMWWTMSARQGADSAADPRAELALAIEAHWLEDFGRPLAWVTGSPAYAASVSFYGDARARYWSAASTHQRTPWIDSAEVLALGSAIVCEWRDQACRSFGEAVSRRLLPLTVAKHTRGLAMPSRTFAVYWLAPHGTDSGARQAAVDPDFR